MIIVNRYGEVVYSTNSPTASWNGIYKNHPAQEGAYIYKVEMTDVFSKSHLLAGTVNLLR
jgi:gliding motility-associated-like protein